MNKYNAKGVWFDLVKQTIILPPSLKQRRSNRNLVHFDSMFEYEVYEKLKSLFPRQQIRIHPRIPVIVEKTKIYPEGLTWEADFAILDAWKNQRYFIEAKGCITEAFRLKMALLEAYNLQTFSRILLVFRHLPDKNDLSWLPEAVRISGLETYFQNLPKYRVS